MKRVWFALLVLGLLWQRAGAQGYTPPPLIEVREDGLAEGQVRVFDFTTNMNLTVSGGVATVSSTGGAGGGLDHAAVMSRVSLGF